MFEELSKREIRRLINSYQIISDEKIVLSMSEFNPSSYRILEEPLPVLLTNDLMSGSWTKQALSEKYGLQIPIINQYVNQLMRDYSILDIGYLPKRTRANGAAEKKTTLYYSYVPIPINARIFDPTFGFSMLKWFELFDWDYRENLAFPTDELNNLYAEQIAGYWNLPKEKVLKALERFQEKRVLKYCMSNYGLLPIINDKSLYSSIKNQLSDDENIIFMKYIRRKEDKEYEYLANLISTGNLSISKIEECAIYLYNSLSHFASKDQEWYEKYQDLNEQLFQAIFMPQFE